MMAAVDLAAAPERARKVFERRPGLGCRTTLMDVLSESAALSDRIVGAALKALHDRPAQAWTLQDLARAAGTSRSVLAERFQQMVGSSPIQYLTRWRMTLAANLLLCRSNVPLAQVAEQVGYQTDTAFSRAFRRQFGAPPSAWRRSQARRGTADSVS
jgi:AraC-like DNA-binding protein